MTVEKGYELDTYRTSELMKLLLHQMQKPAKDKVINIDKISKTNLKSAIAAIHKQVSKPAKQTIASAFNKNQEGQVTGFIELGVNIIIALVASNPSVADLLDSQLKGSDLLQPSCIKDLDLDKLRTQIVDFEAFARSEKARIDSEKEKNTSKSRVRLAPDDSYGSHERSLLEDSYGLDEGIPPSPGPSAPTDFADFRAKYDQDQKNLLSEIKKMGREFKEDFDLLEAKVTNCVSNTIPKLNSTVNNINTSVKKLQSDTKTISDKARTDLLKLEDRLEEEKILDIIRFEAIERDIENLKNANKKHEYEEYFQALSRQNEIKASADKMILKLEICCVPDSAKRFAIDGQAPTDNPADMKFDQQKLLRHLNTTLLNQPGQIKITWLEIDGKAFVRGKKWVIPFKLKNLADIEKVLANRSKLKIDKTDSKNNDSIGRRLGTEAQKIHSVCVDLKTAGKIDSVNISRRGYINIMKGTARLTVFDRTQAFYLNDMADVDEEVINDLMSGRKFVTVGLELKDKPVRFQRRDAM